MLRVAYAECHMWDLCAEWPYAECPYAECRYAECCGAQRRKRERERTVIKIERVRVYTKVI